MIKLHNGDCLDVLKLYPANHFDTLITDPPYGLEFMCKDWDHGIPGIPFWKEILRVCKPGAFALVFGGTRTFHRLTCAIEDAGWEIRDCMMWLYGSGFPKSLDISKAIDKAAGMERKGIIRTDGKATNSGSGCYQMNDSKNKPMQKIFEDGPPVTNFAQLWDGWGTALKPAWEPIIVAMKPLDGTFAQNAEKHGVAGLWIDGGRIGTEQIKTNTKKKGESFTSVGNAQGFNGCPESTHQGRWPANLILDEEAGAMLDEQSGTLKSGKLLTHHKRSGRGLQGNKTFAIRDRTNEECNWGGDSGGASRFFYCAKASKTERNAGLEDMPERPRGPVGDGFDNTLKGPTNALRKDSPTLSQNHHPTVKPLALMEYLCTLTKTPTGGHVLDPFGGSGTTALACMNTGRDCTIIEKESEYCEIIRARVKANDTKKE
jgi:site-specific DNA-methyltransferase (adenine-specific)